MVMSKHRPNIVTDQKCTFCLSPVPDLKALKRYGDMVEVECQCCGTYRISGTAIDVVSHWELDPWVWAAIAYQIKKMTGRVTPPQLVDTASLQSLRETARLPHPDQIIDDFLLWAGSVSHWPGQGFDLRYDNHHTQLGALDRQSFDYMVECIRQSGFFSGHFNKTLDQPTAVTQCALTPRGWMQFRELSRSAAGSTHGFMAMLYGDAELNGLAITSLRKYGLRASSFDG